MLYVCLHPIVHLVEHLLERQSRLLGLGRSGFLGFGGCRLGRPSLIGGGLGFCGLRLLCLVRFRFCLLGLLGLILNSVSLGLCALGLRRLCGCSLSGVSLCFRALCLRLLGRRGLGDFGQCDFRRTLHGKRLAGPLGTGD